MANTRAAKKAMRVSARKRLINRRALSKTRTTIKAAQATLAQHGTAEAVTENIRAAQQAVDKAIHKNVMHKRKAARVKSRLMKKAAQQAQ